MQRITQQDLTEIFGEPIATYTDADALADGILIDIAALKLTFQGRPLTRMTGTLWMDLKPFLEPADSLTALKAMLKIKLRHARNDQAIWVLPPGLWLIMNETGGWTIMKPEDY